MEPGDNYEPELAAPFWEAPVGLAPDRELMQQVVERLVDKEPHLACLPLKEPEGIDTLPPRFPVYLGDPTGTGMIQEELESLWSGDDSAIKATPVERPAWQLE